MSYVWSKQEEFSEAITDGAGRRDVERTEDGDDGRENGNEGTGRVLQL